MLDQLSAVGKANTIGGNSAVYAFMVVPEGETRGL